MQTDTGFPTPLNYLDAQQVTIAKKQKTNKILNTNPIGTRILDKRKSAHRKKEKHCQGSVGTIEHQIYQLRH